MAEKIQCRKYGRPMEALPKPPFPGEEGLRIQREVSRQAWEDWQQLQTMLINEGQLSMADPKARRWLAEQRELFFANGEHARPAGYRPPDEGGA